MTFYEVIYFKHVKKTKIKHHLLTHIAIENQDMKTNKYTPHASPQSPAVSVPGIPAQAILWITLISVLFPYMLTGCAMIPEKVNVKGISRSFDQGTIIKTDTGSPISYKNLIVELQRAQIIYVGEKHSDPVHHKIQLTIIKDIYKSNHRIVVGMEMFDQSYQQVLDQWITGKLDQKIFLKRTHWYANWRMDYQLYADLLDYIKENRIKLIGLNIPFHIPSKIATGGIGSLFKTEKVYLPEDINMSNIKHRQYVKKIFNLHKIRGIEDFENFYAAQCVWEDAMAKAIALNLGSDKMVVIAGNGHIVQKFGIPDRAYKRTGAPFLTLYLAPSGSEVGRSFADYIWITPSKEKELKK